MSEQRDHATHFVTVAQETRRVAAVAEPVTLVRFVLTVELESRGGLHDGAHIALETAWHSDPYRAMAAARAMFLAIGTPAVVSDAWAQLGQLVPWGGQQ